MMSIKDMINKNIKVTHAIVVVFIWVAMEIMEQFDLYVPIPIENVFFFIVVIIALLLSKAQDHTNQNLLVNQEEPTSEFDTVMRALKGLYNEYEKFFRTINKSTSEYTAEDLAKDAAESMTEAHEKDVEEQQAIADGGTW